MTNAPTSQTSIEAKVAEAVALLPTNTVLTALSTMSVLTKALQNTIDASLAQAGRTADSIDTAAVGATNAVGTDLQSALAGAASLVEQLRKEPLALIGHAAVIGK